jgi:hypothetical protein
MDASKIRNYALYGVVVALACVAAWKAAPLLTSSGTPPASANVPPGPHVPSGAVLVNISMIGFDPDTIPATAGQPIELAFFRPNDQNCAREVVFPDLGIEKKLPPGETTVVDITPPKTGALGFACGMNMLKGKLIVR